MRTKYKYSPKYKEESANEWKKTALYFGLTIFLFAVLAVFGIRVLTAIAGVVGGFGQNTAATIKDNTPPPPPRFNNYPQDTNQANINLSGDSEPNSTIKLRFNGDEKDILASNDGSFSINITLQENENKIQAASVDASGNLSLTQTELDIFLDTQSPEIEVSTPQDNSSFKGKKQQEVTVTGKTDPKATLTINDRKIILNDGLFETTLLLNEGDNVLNFVSVDQAGNKTETKRTINYSS